MRVYSYQSCSIFCCSLFNFGFACQFIEKRLQASSERIYDYTHKILLQNESCRMVYAHVRVWYASNPDLFGKRIFLFYFGDLYILVKFESITFHWSKKLQKLWSQHDNLQQTKFNIIFHLEFPLTNKCLIISDARCITMCVIKLMTELSPDAVLMHCLSNIKDATSAPPPSVSSKLFVHHDTSNFTVWLFHLGSVYSD